MENFINSISQAWRDKHIITVNPADCPQNLPDVFTSQAAIAAQIGRDKIGWKIGVHPQWQSIYAPIYRYNPQESLPVQGVMGYEVEIALQLGGDWAGGPIPAQSQLLAGIEILACRLAHKEQLDFLAFLAEGMGNFSYVLGDAVPYDPSLCDPLNHIKIWENDQIIMDAPHIHGDGNPLGTLARFIANPPVLFQGFKGGDIITLGSISGLGKIQSGLKLRAQIANIGAVSVNF